jgi:hypothetical protein
LQQPITFDFDGLPLSEALDRLAQVAALPLRIDRLPLRIDRQALYDEGIPVDLPVTLHARSLPLAAALERLLPRHISFLVENRELLITARKRLEEQRQTRLYDVRGLTSARGLGDDGRLVDLITAHVQPLSWDAAGGPGSITCHSGLLVVTQSPGIQREVEALLNVVGTLRVPPSSENDIANDGTPTRSTGAPVPATSDDEFAFQSLTGLVQLDLQEVPLAVALARLAPIAGVPIWLDPRGLSEAGIDGERPVTLVLEGSTLAGALDRLLPEGISYCIQGGELVVTSKEEAEGQQSIRLFDVGAAAPELAENIVRRGAIEALYASYWSAYGGRGEITAISDSQLLVTADIVRHGQIDDWLCQRQTGKTPLREIERQGLEEWRAARDAEVGAKVGIEPPLDPFAAPP